MFPNQKFSIIYADPPWQYNARAKNKTKFGGGAMAHYPTMTHADICALPVQDIAASNCVLFIWVTFPKLKEGLEVIDAWGFEYKTLGFSWHKTNKNGGLFFGVGSYTKSNCEVCLMATRGRVGIKPDSNKLVVQSHKISSAINAPLQRHSKKPDDIRDRIVGLFGDVPRIELFAREASPGWHAWGNQLQDKPC